MEDNCLPTHIFPAEDFCYANFVFLFLEKAYNLIRVFPGISFWDN